MSTNQLILAVTLLAAAVWFRYLCALALRSPVRQEPMEAMAAANGLAFPEVKQQLQLETPSHRWIALEQALCQDFALLCYLLRHASEYRTHLLSLELRLLAVDFYFVHLQFWTAGRLSSWLAKRSLRRMIAIIQHFSSLMGERLVTVRT